MVRRETATRSRKRMCQIIQLCSLCCTRQNCKHPDTNTNVRAQITTHFLSHTHTHNQMPTCSTHVAERSSCRGVLVAPQGRVRVIHSSCPRQFSNNIPPLLTTGTHKQCVRAQLPPHAHQYLISNALGCLVCNFSALYSCLVANI